MYDLKELIKGNVYFVEYRKGNLWYEAGRHLNITPYQFPVPISDIGDGIFKAVDKGILFMRYIRKSLDLRNKALERYEEFTNEIWDEVQY